MGPDAVRAEGAAGGSRRRGARWGLKGRGAAARRHPGGPRPHAAPVGGQRAAHRGGAPGHPRSPALRAGRAVRGSGAALTGMPSTNDGRQLAKPSPDINSGPT